MKVYPPARRETRTAFRSCSESTSRAMSSGPGLPLEVHTLGQVRQTIIFLKT